jgi:hypothetical protein
VYGIGKDLSVGTDALGNDEVWLRASDDRIWRYDQGKWFDTGGQLVSIQAGKEAVFGLTDSGQFWHFNDQTGWTNPRTRSATTFKSLSVGTDAQGGDEVWLLTEQGEVWRYDQGKLSLAATGFSTIQAGHGQFFGLTATGDFWAYNDQTPDRFTSSERLGWGFKSVSVGHDARGNDEAWLLGNDNSVWRYDHQGQMAKVGDGFSAIKAGREEVFGLKSNGEVYSFNDQSGLSGQLAAGMTSMAVGTDSAGGDQLWLEDGVGHDFLAGRGHLGQNVHSLHGGQAAVYGLDDTGRLFTFKENGELIDLG